MRKVLAIILALALGQASSILAAAPALGGISGRAVDAAGRGAGGQRVDLVQGGHVLSSAVTDTRGSWSFVGVNAGEYVVRTSINGTIAGTRVTVGSGQVVSGMMIVVPTAAVSPQFGALASIMANVAAGSVTAVTAATTAVVNKTEAVSLDASTVAEILTRLEPEARQAFAQAVVQAIQDNAAGTNQGQASEATSNIFVDVVNTSTGTTVQTNNFLQVIQQIAVTPLPPPGVTPPPILIVPITAS